MPRGSKGASRKIIAREREARALQLRRMGFTYEQIARELGVSVSGAHRIVMRALQRLTEKVDAEAKVVRTLELDRLDALLRREWLRMQDGDPRAVDRILKIIDQRAKLLGLYTTDVNVSMTGPIRLVWPEELEGGGGERGT